MQVPQDQGIIHSFIYRTSAPLPFPPLLIEHPHRIYPEIGKKKKVTLMN